MDREEAFPAVTQYDEASTCRPVQVETGRANSVGSILAGLFR